MSRCVLDIDTSRDRQRRLLEVMRKSDLSAAVLARSEHVQWLTGVWFPWFFEPMAILRADGYCTLIAPNESPAASAADDVRTYEAQWHSTLRNDQARAASAVLVDALRSLGSIKRIGVEFSTCPQHVLAGLDADYSDLDPDLFYLRRRKSLDELELLRTAIRGTETMYQRSREIIEPGVSELAVFNSLQAAAVDEFGEMLTGTGNDYACGVPGGPPRNNRTARDGELYILDLGPAYRGYFADNCRTISVNRHPTDEQQRAWETIVSIFPLVESTVRPGASCRELFEAANARLNEYLPGGFDHHLGHGIGLFPHEAPHVNPHWDDQFEEGDVFTIEPGLYSDELAGGIRIENDYLVTADGVELLTDFPLEL